jgi:hypothetical protein
MDYSNCVVEPSNCTGPSLTDRFGTLPIVRFRLGRNRELIYSPLDGSARVFSTSAAALLQACSDFGTLEDQVRKVSPLFRVEQLRPHVIRTELLKFVDRGYLVSDNYLLGRSIARADTVDTPGQISILGMVTRNRCSELQSSVVSYIHNFNYFGRTPSIVVIDASDAPGERRRCVKMLQSIQREYQGQILYAGVEEKRQYAERLAKSVDCPPEIVTFALFGAEECEVAIGANRNALLLDTVGELLFSVDDDTLGQMATMTDDIDRSGLCVGSRTPTEFWFFSTRDQALQAVSFLNADILGSHERMLGRELDAVVHSYVRTAGEVRIGQACSHLVRSLYAGGGHVLLTLNGVLGDSGMHSSTGLLGQGGQTRERLLRSAKDYQCALSSREVLRVAPLATIYHGPDCMAGMIGLDNRRLLPPFQPVLRNSDGIFGVCVHACFQDSYSAYLPFGMIHAAPEGRRYMSDYISSTSAIRLCDISIAEIRACSVPSRKSHDETLCALGGALIESANLPEMDFQEKLKMRLWEEASKELSGLADLLDRYRDSPQFWVADMKQKIDVWLRALQDPYYYIPCDLTPSRSVKERAQLTQDLLLRFGQLLWWWPTLVESAKVLRGSGHRMSRPVTTLTV